MTTHPSRVEKRKTNPSEGNSSAHCYKVLKLFYYLDRSLGSRQTTVLREINFSIILRTQTNLLISSSDLSSHQQTRALRFSSNLFSPQEKFCKFIYRLCLVSSYRRLFRNLRMKDTHSCRIFASPLGTKSNDIQAL